MTIDRPFPDLRHDINGNLSNRFNESGPYYTSYPSLGRWSTDFTHAAYVDALPGFLEESGRLPLHLYVHIPFCAKLCYYCICNIQISNDYDTKQRFVDDLCREVDMLCELFAARKVTPNIKEIHLGGGTPSHLSNEQFAQILQKLRNLVNLETLCEFAMEIDPRTTTREKLQFYSSHGIDRISFGIQDFDPNVQKAINRVQPPEMIDELLTPQVREGFDSINFDLLFGLPLQTLKTFERTVGLVKSLSPDRVTLLKYAHAPEIKKHMKLIDAETLPAPTEFPLMFSDTVQSFTAAGYDWVGIDHFAKPSDKLAEAAREKRVWRNFGGFTPGRTRNLIGLGPSATCAVGRHYFQSVYGTNEYSKAIASGQFPIARGFEMSADDVLRREVIFRIICHGCLDYDEIESDFDICFRDYFHSELLSLSNFEEDGILEVDASSFELTPLGRFFARNVAKVFDRFLQNDRNLYQISGP